MSTVNVAISASEPIPEPIPEPEPTQPPTTVFSVADSVVTVGGNTALSWMTTDADGCEASGAWSGVKDRS